MKRARALRYVLVGLLVAMGGVVAFFVIAVARSLDTHRDLSDFASAAEARDFTSAHLPAPLPASAVVESLSYDRWTDWTLDARVRLASASDADRYVEDAKRARKLDDSYCYDDEPTNGARYFLAGVHACGRIQRASALTLEVHCNTR